MLMLIIRNWQAAYWLDFGFLPGQSLPHTPAHSAGARCRGCEALSLIQIKTRRRDAQKIGRGALQGPRGVAARKGECEFR